VGLGQESRWNYTEYFIYIYSFTASAEDLPEVCPKELLTAHVGELPLPENWTRRSY
jgi:hypothetical protein